MHPELSESPKTQEGSSRKQKRILIIDEHESDVQALSQRLGQHGFAVSTAKYGHEGLVSARAMKPHVVLLDLRLPDADGRAICEQIVDSPETSGTPVILLGGFEHPDIVRSCRAAGCHFFLRKPFDPNALLLLIRQSIVDMRRWSGRRRRT
jgi:CheY-like chemotaxis protein